MLLYLDWSSLGHFSKDINSHSLLRLNIEVSLDPDAVATPERHVGTFTSCFLQQGSSSLLPSFMRMLHCMVNGFNGLVLETKTWSIIIFAAFLHRVSAGQRPS